ncbi:uncharacterized protein LOC123472444 [Daphnia magna]|uniref:uncharacterized protein LOC123472444 n=1 Tax=Daphnia magna TaxID=35525 RepID=UPI001E1BA2F4|nr:uncharacterized protein LOC123472444 [Daphnia magna]
MRYENVYLINCVLFKMKSSRAYKFLREMQLLPLPGLSTIRRLMSSSQCVLGFNKLALENICEAMSGKSAHERWGGVMLDEMANAKGIDFDTCTLPWKGTVDYGGEISDLVPNGLADHILVFVFRPYLAGWIQPFAWFGTKGGASGTILVELIIKAFACLHNHGAIAKHVVFDGNQTNKSLMKQFGISGEEEGASCLDHPLQPDSKIHFMVDVPHLLKVVRNNMESHRCVQFQGHLVNYKHYEELFDFAKTKQITLGYHLSYAHIHPNNFQKMNVRLCAQLFSNKTAMAFNILRNQQEDTEGQKT